MKKLSLLIILGLIQGCATDGGKKSSDQKAVTSKSATATSQEVKAAEPVKSIKTEEYPNVSVVSSDSNKEAEAGESLKNETPNRSAPSDYLNSELMAAVKGGNAAEIRKICNLILNRNENDVRALNSLAILYYKEGRYEMAKYLLNKALSNTSDTGPIYSNLGIVTLAQGEERDAILLFRKALQIEPNDPIANSNLGAIYVARKDYAKALLVLETAYSKGQKDLKTANNYAVALLAAKENSKAEEILTSLMRSGEATREIKLNYAVLLIERLNKYKEGLDVLSRLKFELGSDAHASNSAMGAAIDRLEKIASQNAK